MVEFKQIYLQVIHCQITKIEIDAVNLKAFVYKGFKLRVDLSEAKGLETVDIEFFGIALDYLLTAIPSALPSVQNLTIEARILQEVCSLNALFAKTPTF